MPMLGHLYTAMHDQHAKVRIGQARTMERQIGPNGAAITLYDVGRRIGRLILRDRLGRDGDDRWIWRAVCDCKAICIVTTRDLRRGIDACPTCRGAVCVVCGAPLGGRQRTCSLACRRMARRLHQQRQRQRRETVPPADTADRQRERYWAAWSDRRAVAANYHANRMQDPAYREQWRLESVRRRQQRAERAFLEDLRSLKNV
jgi:hypothetical protein